MRFQNVFVLCTGRCGSVTFAQAASHITNATAGHETRSHVIGSQRMAYPTQHIEVDNRLSWVLGRLDQTYGRSAFYVHLTRDPKAVAASFAARHDRGIMGAYAQNIMMGANRKNPDATPVAFAEDYVETITANITHFLRDKPSKMRFRLEHAAQDMAQFWREAGAEGDLIAASAEWDIKHNARH
jgi:hypothetical protein